MHTIKRLAALQEEDANEGLTKRDEDSPSPSAIASPDWRASISPSRLSNLFDGWIHTSTPTSPTRASAVFIPDKRTVGEPKLVEHGTGNVPIHTSASDDRGADDLDLADFEQMVVCLSRYLFPSITYCSTSGSWVSKVPNVLPCLSCLQIENDTFSNKTSNFGQLPMLHPPSRLPCRQPMQLHTVHLVLPLCYPV